MLSDVDGSPTEPKCFLNISTGRLLRIKVLELGKQHKTLTTADGLLIISHDTGTKLLNPLTRFCIRFPPLSFYQETQLRVTSAAATSNCTVILCIALYNENGEAYLRRTVRYARRNSRSWRTLEGSSFLSDNVCFQNTLLFQDVLYSVDGTGMIKGLNLNMQPVVRTIIPPTFGSDSLSFFLVECRDQMFLVRKVSVDGSQNADFEVFMVGHSQVPSSNEQHW